MPKAIKTVWDRRPLILNQDRLLDRRADALLDKTPIPRWVWLASRFWLVCDWLWIHRPIVTTNHRRAEAETHATVKGYQLGRDLAELVPSSAEVRRHAERITSTGAVLVAVV